MKKLKNYITVLIILFLIILSTSCVSNNNEEISTTDNTVKITSDLNTTLLESSSFKSETTEEELPKLNEATPQIKETDFSLYDSTGMLLFQTGDPFDIKDFPYKQIGDKSWEGCTALRDGKEIYYDLYTYTFEGFKISAGNFDYDKKKISSEKNFIFIISITSSSFLTARGIKVGDTKKRLNEVYGYGGLFGEIGNEYNFETYYLYQKDVHIDFNLDSSLEKITKIIIRGEKADDIFKY